MLRPCPQKIDCPPVLPYTNYSAETIKLIEYYGNPFPPGDTPYGDEWKATGCLGIGCVSTISQEDADLCALRQLALCVPGQDYPSDPQECTVACPDGSLFTYVVPAGAFLAATLEEANAQAYSYACRQAALQRFCLSDVPLCCCEGEAYSGYSQITENMPQTLLLEVDSGTMPPGISMEFRNGRIYFEGTALVAGAYSFTIRATNELGHYATCHFDIQVIGITDTSLPDLTIGTPYSHQLHAVGGSGNYLWTIVSGGLPDGLSLSAGGLISGTPTTGGSVSFTVEVTDPSCQAHDRAGKNPAVSITTVSTTRIATILGYDEFIPSNPPKRYRRCTWTGYSEHQGVALCASPNQYCLTTAGSDPIISPGGDVSTNIVHAKYVYDGAGEISANGTQISNYTKLFYSACPELRTYPTLRDTDFETRMLGYCWRPGASACSEGCEDPMPLVEDVAVNSSYDFSDLWYTGPTIDPFVPKRWVIYSSTHAGQDVDQQKDYLMEDQSFGPHFDHPEWASAPQWTLRMTNHHHYSVTLDQEYTDAMAYANAKLVLGHSRVAENRPRAVAGNPSFESRYTSVIYDINITNLIPGETYELTIEYLDKLNQSVLTTEIFTALGESHVISGSVPTPIPGDTMKLNRAFVNFV